MELVHAPVPELKGMLTELFEEWAAASDPSSTASCALSGGATALLFLPALRAANADWSRITLFWADERAVAPDHPESNFGLADRMLLTPLGARAPRAIRMPTELPLAEAALKYDDELHTELSGRAMDLAILGVGEDGHVCSLFPSTQAIPAAPGLPSLRTSPATPMTPASSDPNPLRVMVVEDAPKPPHRRLSLTLRFVLQTRKIWLVAVGPRKLPALHAALAKTQRSTPLDLLLQQAKDVTVFTDQVIRRR